RDLDTTTLRELIDFEGRLIPDDLQPGVPRVGIPRSPRASMQDLYERIVLICKDPITHLNMLSHSMISIISSTHLCHHSISNSSRRMMMSSVEMTEVGCVTEKKREGHETEMT
ncbi:hypothetical protein Tco_0240256, partial [Tanacetum coccineum]